MIKFACPKCGQRFNVPPAHAGKTASCPQCKGQVVVPSPTGAKKTPAAGGDDFGALLNMLDSTPAAGPAPQHVGADQLARPERSKALEAATLPFWLVGQAILAFLRKFSIELSVLVVILAVAGGVYWFVLRDKWEDENLPRLIEAKARGDTLHDNGQYKPAIDEYQTILDAVRDRPKRSDRLTKLVDEVTATISRVSDRRDKQVLDQFTEQLRKAPNDPANDAEAYIAARSAILKSAAALITTNKDLLAVIRQVRESRDEAALVMLRAQLAELHAQTEDKPGVRLAGYKKLAGAMNELPDIGVNVSLFRDNIDKLTREVQEQARSVEAYFNSIDPFLNTLIPFVRRLRWGMPESMFATRVTQVLEGWRRIPDPPDRTTAGLLLSYSNSIAAHFANLDTKRRERQPLTSAVYINLLLNAKPVDLNDAAWRRRIDEYVALVNSQITERSPDGVLLANIGSTIQLTPEAFDQLYNDLRMFERTFRVRYEVIMGTPYQGTVSTIDDKLNPRLRAEFNNSLEPFLETAVPTLRRLERGAERRALLDRLVAMDNKLKAVVDPPDDSDIGSLLIEVNKIASLLHEYSFVRQGVSGADIVGQDDPDSKAANDAAEQLMKVIKERRTDPATPQDIKKYDDAKRAWLAQRIKEEDAARDAERK